VNNLEKRMVDSLIDLKENHDVIGVKAEFEAEGTRLEEASRLKEVVSRAGLELTIKIGGCEAIKDMYEARVIGVSRIVAPMIETAYALKKFISATRLVFTKEEYDSIDFLINIETITAYKNLDEILSVEEIKYLDGIVLGRVDMTQSMGLTREDINCNEIFEITRDVFTKAKNKSLECAIGGGVSAETIKFINNLPEGLTDRYETRKVIFKCPEALNKHPDEGILKAVGFELMWLKNKRNFYGMIHMEDQYRIQYLEARYEKLISEAGGVCV
jgi:4-hydroxy-2-oxoheptanedioate aldolase